MEMVLDIIVMGIGILEVILIILEMVRVIIFLLMVILMKEIGSMGKRMEKGSLYLKMGMFMKESLKIILLMGKEIFI